MLLCAEWGGGGERAAEGGWNEGELVLRRRDGRAGEAMWDEERAGEAWCTF